jgi:transposase
MTKKDLNNWFMYYEIHRFKRLGFSVAKIAHYLTMDARTVSRYLSMSEQEYEQSLIHASVRNKTLDSYEAFVAGKLSEYQDTSAAQIHDWLKEHHPDFPDVSSRTVYNYVMFIRGKHNIPIEPKYRDYFPVEELPYGEQAQVDFGEYNMHTSDGKRKKVKFFAMVLSRSRMKYIWFLDKPFTSETVVDAHEKAFEFYGGIPRVLVYDQDRTIIVDENIGDIILTATFKQYTKSRSFKLHFCRKADPESKGKIENVVQYVKKNFLYNRTYFDMDALNDDAISWLGRTANFLEHNYTKKSPQSEYHIEKEHLSPFFPLTLDHIKSNTYHVRKTNIISYKSNFYILPAGTYQGTGTQVIAKEKEGVIQIYNQKQELLCSHPLSELKGQTVGGTDRGRDTSKSLQEMIDQISSYFTDKPLVLMFLDKIRKKYPRYTRDHLLAILKTLTEGEGDGQTADKTLKFCIKNDLSSGLDLRDVYYCILDDSVIPEPQKEITLLDRMNLQKANETPQISNIDDYETIINK